MDKYKVLTDSDLVSLLKQRDREAFAEIYDRYSMMIYYKVNQMLRDENAAKDLVQDLFTSIWEKSDLIRDNVGISSYLYVASRNRVLNYIQRGKTKSDYLAEIGKYSLQVSDATLEMLDEKDLMLLITDEIAKLPAKMREVFELSRLEDLSHREIAERLNVSESTVKKQVQNALKILKVRLSDYHSLGVLLLVFMRGS
ncbi:RNA polymerase sigma factor [Sphingobacterium spiritivorum]|uniref:RNA polymerase sigma factor n=1 Tax=Sphingobacterium spiritivorum TaxID=258 RepID=UPI003DA6672C